MNRISNGLLVLLLSAIVFFMIFHGYTFMEPVNDYIMNAGTERLLILVCVAAIILVIPQIIQGATRSARDAVEAVHSVTDHGVEGWASVKKIYRTQEKLGNNILYFMDLHIEDESGREYPITVLHPVRRKELGFFIPGSRVPVKSAIRDRSMLMFPQLDYRKMGSFLFLNENSEIWEKALKTKEEISLMPSGEQKDS